MTSSLQATTDRERNAERTRSAVLDAAERLFAAQGYEGTSLNQVGSEAGVSRATPSYFFGSKAELYQAVLDRCYQRTLEAIRSGRERALASGRSPEAVMAGLVADYYDFITSNRNWVRLMEREALRGPAGTPLADAHAAVVREALGAIADELPQLAGDPQETAQLLLSVLSLCWFSVVHSARLLPSLGMDPESPEFHEMRKNHVVGLVLQGINGRLTQTTAAEYLSR